MNILGLNAFHGDASAALLRDGQLVLALEEERLNRVKHWAGLPLLAARMCLQGTQPDHIAISRDPRAHLREKLLRTAMRPHRWLDLTSRAVNSVRIARVGDIKAYAKFDRSNIPQRNAYAPTQPDRVVYLPAPAAAPAADN